MGELDARKGARTVFFSVRVLDEIFYIINFLRFLPKAGELKQTVNRSEPPWRAAVETAVFDGIAGIEYDIADRILPH